MIANYKDELAFLPEMIEGEILYSWVGHYHRLSGNAFPINSSRQLFGDMYSGFRRDFYSQIDYFVSVTNGIFGDAETLSYQRSLLGFFAPFKSEDIVNNVLHRMKGRDVKSLKAELGLVANRLGAYHWLKSCQDCMKEDLASFYISKWYLEHQFPTSWICRKHNKKLRVAKRGLFPERHVNLILPHDIEGSGWEDSQSFSTGLFKALSKVSDFVSNLSNKRGFYFDRFILRYTYLLGVRNRGWIRTDGAVKAELWDAFQNYYQGIDVLPELKYGKLMHNSHNFISQLMRQHDYSQHPLRHFLLMGFLFDSIDEFHSSYDQVSSAYSDNGLNGIRDLLNQDFRKDLKRLIEEEKLTIACAAKALNVTFTQAKNSIEAYGINYRKRYDLDEELKKKLHELIYAGVSRKIIEKSIGVDNAFLKYFFKLNPMFNVIWKEKNFVRIRNETRLHYQSVLSKKSADVTVTMLLDHLKSGFWWLRTHDLDWLVINSPLKVKEVLLESIGVSVMRIISDDLFSSTPAFLPQLSETETIYSWAARFHRLSGNALAKDSSIQLYGDSRAGLRYDFPSHLDGLFKNTNGLIGDVNKIAYQHTLFGFFAPFQSQDGAFDVLSLMRKQSVEKVKSALGLLPSRVGGFFPLKACQVCMREDLNQYSVSQWHNEHQWPSTWICRKHQKILQAVKREFQPRDLRRWLLPEDIADVEWEKYVVSHSIKTKLLSIAEFSDHIVNSRDRHLDGQLLRYTYLKKAKELDWLYTDGSLKLAQVKQAFLKYFRGFEEIPGFDVVLTAHAEHGGMLGLLMRQYDWKRHPVKHLVLITFLFRSTDDFDQAYAQVSEFYAEGGMESVKQLVSEEWKFKLKYLVETEGKSLSAAAAAVGIPLSVAMRVAKRDVISYQRRTRVFDTALGKEIKTLIGEGLSRNDILNRTGIKKSLLKDMMAREPLLRDAWRNQDFERRKKAYRVNFLSMIDQYRGVPVKKLRSIPGNGVSWLYRNDREWLVKNTPQIW